MISLAVGGKLYRNRSEEELKEIHFKELGRYYKEG